MANFEVVTSSSNPGPAVTSSSNTTKTPQTSGGYMVGQSVTDLVGFYGTTPIVQQANTVDLTTQLVNLGLVPSGTSAANNASTVAAGSTLTLTSAHNGKTIKLDTLTGSVVTLPAATGSGARYSFLVTVLATSNSHVVKVASATDFMIGIAATMSDDPATVKAFAAANSGTVATNSDTITLNRTTTGSVVVGEHFTLTDIAAATWQITDYMTASTGTEATPFSAGV